MILQKHYELAKRAHYGTSFSPEKRADGIVRDYSAELENDLISIPEVERKRFQENYEKYFTNWLHAKSNCISTMIAGPANFPTRRAEKANRSEENRYKEFRSFRERALKAIEKKHKPESEVKSENWERFEKDIRRAALAFVDAKFKGGFGNPPLFQASIVNKIEVQAKNGNVEFVEKALQLIQKFEKPIFTQRHRIWKFNELAKQINEVNNREDSQLDFEGGYVIQSWQENRVKIFFDEKPERSVIDFLKKNSFKWAPSTGAWQRFNTPAGVQAVRDVLNFITKNEKINKISK